MRTLSGVADCRSHGRTFPGAPDETIRCSYCGAARGLAVPQIASSVAVPASAVIARTVQGSYRTKDGDRASVTATLWAGSASHGYRTDYEHRPAAWIVVCRSHRLPWQSNPDVHRYSGARYARAATDMDELASALAASAEVPA